MKRGISIIITPTDSGNSKYLFLSKMQINTLFTLFIALLIVVLIAILSYSRLSYKAIESEILKKRNTEIEKEFSKLEEIKKNLEIAEINNQKIKIMLGLEKNPIPVEPVITEVSENYSKIDTISIKEEENIPSLMPASGQISKKFGIGHEAIDLAAPLFSPVIAAASGKVIATGWDSLYGNYIVIEHSKNYTTFYGHLNSVAHKKGERVKTGELIGTVGSSGKSTSPHLHYEVRFQDTPVDPMPYLPYIF